MKIRWERSKKNSTEENEGKGSNEAKKDLAGNIEMLSFIDMLTVSDKRAEESEKIVCSSIELKEPSTTRRTRRNLKLWFK